MYVGVYFVCYSFSSVLLIVSEFDGRGLLDGRYYWLQILEAFFFPFQGLPNLLIYVKRRYQGFHQRIGKPREALFKAIFSFCESHSAERALLRRDLRDGSNCGV